MLLKPEVRNNKNPSPASLVKAVESRRRKEGENLMAEPSRARIIYVPVTL